MSYIYILTNPSIPDYVKIGSTSRTVQERVNEFNASTCIPLSFRIYATYEVSTDLADIKLQAIIDQLRPDLRAIETCGGKPRTREFYQLSPEEAYSLLEAMAEIHGCKDKLKKYQPTNE